jgi:hypothetical protein
MYLTFGQIYTCVQDGIDCRIQLLPFPPRHNLKYAIDHTLELVASITTSPSASSSKTPTQLTPPSFTRQPCHLSRPDTEIYRNHSICAPHFSLLRADLPYFPITIIVPTFPTADTQLQRLPVTGSPAIGRLTGFYVHRHIGFRHLRDYTIIQKCGTDAHLASQGEPPFSQADLATIDRKNKGKSLSSPAHFLENVGMDIGYGHPGFPGGFKYSLLIIDYKTHHKYIYGFKGITGADIHRRLVSIHHRGRRHPGYYSM